MEQNPAVALFFALAVILAASRIGGAIARRMDQPRVLGELIIGVLLGWNEDHVEHHAIDHGIMSAQAAIRIASDRNAHDTLTRCERYLKLLDARLH